MKAKDVMMGGADLPDGGRIAAAVSVTERAGVAMLAGLSNPPAGLTYQMWVAAVPPVEVHHRFHLTAPSATIRPTASTAVRAPTANRLRITATATPVSMSAHAAEPFIPIMPNVEPARPSTPPGRYGL